MRRLIRFAAVAALSIGWQVAAVPPTNAGAVATAQAASNNCQLGNGIQHVVNVVFDNVHLTRDNPNVPSDLEQMPNLLNFIENNGVMVSHNYTPLISHTANDIVTTLTGLYPDQQGLLVANSYGFFRPNGTVGFTSAFQYWTDKISNGTYNNLTADGMNTPAPWVPFTRAGCNVGGVSTANIELENNGNIVNVFGAGSPEAAEAAADPTRATADFIGIAIHCAKDAAVCAAGNQKPDVLPQEPGGYNGFTGLFGHKYVAPVISPNGPLTDLNGNVIQDSVGNVGFPGFGGISASQSLSYVASMEEHGVPVVYDYISDAHDDHVAGQAFGPGEAGYVAQLKSYDQAFGKFFARLAKDGITPQNTLFNFSSDENDHFAGKLLPNCDGVTTPCVYDHSLGTGNIGEITTNLKDLMAKAGVSTPFTIHLDSAPSVYLIGNPARDAGVTRTFEQASATLVDPTNYVTGLKTPLMQRLADSVELKNLHMATGDPARTPTFIYFGNPDYFFVTGGPDFQQNAAFAWQHGDFQPEIVTSWLGLVGPGVLNLGLDDQTWASHADTRPTILALTGLKDDYRSEGRVLLEDLDPGALPQSLRAHHGTLVKLGQAYSQINAPVGQFGLDTLKISTTALESSSAGDATYTALETELTGFGQQRDPLARQMIAAIDGAEFNNQVIDQQQAKDLIAQAQALLDQVHAAAA
jgi:hypothetical protein